mgnify:CR=1 FL=1
MKKFNLFKDYSKLKVKRIANSKTRTIKERIISSYRDKNLYDGSRKYGYGGFVYDGRWKKIAEKICKTYNLDNTSKILHLGCEKGFLLQDIKKGDIFNLNNLGFMRRKNKKIRGLTPKAFFKIENRKSKFSFKKGQLITKI